MALPENALPFGLRDVRIIPVLADGTRDTPNAVDLPASRVFSFKETEDFETLEGDDTTVAAHGKGALVEWELESGGISLAAWRAMAGGTTTTSGTAPAEIQTFSKKNTDARPYFDVEGQAISDSGGDFHTEVFRCKADGDLEANMENGSFLLTAASGKGYGRLSDGELYIFTHNSTVTPIA